MATMARKIGADLPEFVKMFSPEDLNNYGMYIRVRSIQMKGEVCGTKLSMEDMHDILALCARDTVKNKNAYLGIMLSKFRIEATLRSLRSRKKISTDERIYAVAKYVRGITKWQLQTIWGYIEGKYSMADIVDMCELCNHKEKPGAYMIGILKRGYCASRN